MAGRKVAGHGLAVAAAPWVGRRVWARWKLPCTDPAEHAADPEYHDYWYEPWSVVGVTGVRVKWLLVEDGFGVYGYTRLDDLERRGHNIAWERPDGRCTKGVCVIYLERPESVRRRTIGYLAGVDAPLAVLGLPPEAETDAARIRSAYRALAREHHPDHGGDPQAFMRVQAAWERLRERLD